MFTTLGVFFVILLLLVLSHELGHFLLAKWNGVKVEEFGFGLPPRLFGFRKGDTLYSFNLLPFGGFVRIEGEEATDGIPVGPTSFASKSIAVRSFIIAAGVFFNLLLAWILLSAAGWYGLQIAVDDTYADPAARVIVTEVQKDSPAESAGLLAGDAIVRMAIGDEKLAVHKIGEVQDFVSRHKGERVSVTYQRNGKEASLAVEPRSVVREGEGALGIAMARVGVKRFPWYAAWWEGLKNTASLTWATIAGFAMFFYGIISGSAGLGGISGPVGIAGIVANALHFGFSYAVQLVALLSVNLAVINVIPFPGLDGGRLLFLGIEAVTGKAIDAKTSSWAHTLGLIILLALLFVVTYHDLSKL